MTKNNEQIIIDEEGKDCAFYVNGECTCSDFCAVLYCVDAPLCIYKQWLSKEQELNKAKQIILQAIKDFSFECGTPYYDRLLESAKSLGIEVKDYE